MPTNLWVRVDFKRILINYVSLAFRYRNPAYVQEIIKKCSTVANSLSQSPGAESEQTLLSNEEITSLRIRRVKF